MEAALDKFQLRHFTLHVFLSVNDRLHYYVSKEALDKGDSGTKKVEHVSNSVFPHSLAHLHRTVILFSLIY